jgi:hypothetical protein
VDRGSCDRHPAHLGWLPCCTCPDGPANWFLLHTCSASAAKRRDHPEESRGSPGHGDRPHIRHRQAVYGLHSAPSVRVVPGPTISLALAVEIALALSLAVAVAVEIALSFAFAVEIALALSLVIPVADGLRPDGLSCAAC